MSVTGQRAKAMRDILALNHTNLQRTAYADVLDNAIVTGDLLNTNIAATVANLLGLEKHAAWDESVLAIK
jgi:hypothetical protein